MVTYSVVIKDSQRADPQGALKAMRKVQAIMLAGEAAIFEAEGPNWAPLAPSTIARRRQGRSRFGGVGVKKLRDKGLLHGSMTALSHPDGIREVSETRAVVGTRRKYGEFHQDGTRHMPARPFARIREEDLPLIDAAIADGFIDTLGRSA